MVSGTDEHGTPIIYGADREGISPRQFADCNTGQTLPDRYIEGTCPICGYPEARSDWSVPKEAPQNA